jgi:hypothetical protein
MTPERFRKLIAKHFADPAGSRNENDEGQQAFARWLPAAPRSVRRWVVDGPPAAVARLLELIELRHIRPASVPDQNGKVAK